MAALDDCPFCGSADPEWVKSNDKVHPYRVVCKSCGAGTAHHGGPQASWKAWNTRASPSQVPAHPADMREKVIEAIQSYFVDQTGFATVDGEGNVSAYYGGNWITLSPAKIADAIISLLATSAIDGLEGWQPIETAPKVHGQMILSINRYGVIDTICWNDSIPGWDDGFGHEQLDGDDGRSLGFDATYWQPLPAPPAIRALGNSGQVA